MSFRVLSVLFASLAYFRLARGWEEVHLDGLIQPNELAIETTPEKQISHKERMIELIKDIPKFPQNPLDYVFETMNLQHEPETLWLEFGVFRGRTISYISRHTTSEVYGFDSFLGLPERWRAGYEKGEFYLGQPPSVPSNVRLLKGWFNETLPQFLRDTYPKKISFIHIDCDLYSSTKCVLNLVKDRLAPGCVIVFDEILNYPGFDGDTGELKAFYEFVTENKVKFEWIGTNGAISAPEQAALKILEVNGLENI